MISCSIFVAYSCNYGRFQKSEHIAKEIGNLATGNTNFRTEETVYAQSGHAAQKNEKVETEIKTVAKKTENTPTGISNIATETVNLAVEAENIATVTR